MGQFERIRYPDGQIGAKYVESQTEVNNMLIKERINSYEDLFYVRAIADVINHNDVYMTGTQNFRLFIPCMFGQRSDRRFDRFQSFDLKLIADIINECNFGRVDVLDPHSDMTVGLIHRCERVDPLEYVERAIREYHAWNAAYHNYSVDPVLIAPDGGAFKKVFGYGERLKLEVIGANKHRNNKGEVDGLTLAGDVKDKYCFIVDDLCDGGYTFLVLADELRKRGAKEVHLYVTHGIFSKGLFVLREQIDHIYCTNSVSDIDVKSYAFGSTNLKDASNFVTQFKVL